MPTTAAYLHVPFCTHRCGYCNFTLISGRDDLVPRYLDAVELILAQSGVRPVSTLYCGGGTPAYLQGSQLQRFLDLCRTWHPLSPSGEWSIEANPNDLDPDVLQQLRQAGVTRVSLGAQSFAPRKPQLLERSHSPEQIVAAVRWGQALGLAMNVDLIFGVPGETPAEWADDLRLLCELQPEHVSTYGLTWERGTQFWNRQLHGQLQPATEETERTLYAAAINTLTTAGWEHYEISNFAKPGFRCRHNEVYWSGEEYYATGPGAARYLNGVRSSDHRSTTTWIKRVLSGLDPTAEREELPPLEKAGELLVFGLRRIEGVSAAWFAERTGFALADFLGPRGEQLLSSGLLRWVGDRLQISSDGLFVADSVCAELLRR